ncbi:hypothetical protein, partial [Escherichia coli]|uniref:hypothetical protein n=1 Tax=Escherichia coli TaxID=562 RepID=UPI001CCFE98A
TNVGELLNSEISVIRNSDNKKLDIRSGYSVAVVDNTKDIVITINHADARTAETAYRVSVDGAKYITDKSVQNNPIANFSVTTDRI